MDTRERILDTAQRLAQRRGFNAFSYADIAETVGIRKASIHHHFASKDDLELAMVQRYREGFSLRLKDIEHQHKSARQRLRHYGLLHLATLADGGICLCGMMASDIAALPEVVRAPLRMFFDEQANWLSATLESGRQGGEFTFAGSPSSCAMRILASLQGGLIIAHACQNPSLLKSLLDDALAGLRPQ